MSIFVWALTKVCIYLNHKNNNLMEVIAILTNAKYLNGLLVARLVDATFAKAYKTNSKTRTIKAVVTSTNALNGAYFGHTFDVCDIHPGGRVSLKIEGRTVDFSFREVLIVDLPALAQEVYELSWSSTSYPFPFMPGAQTPTALYTALCRFADIRYVKHTLTHGV